MKVELDPVASAQLDALYDRDPAGGARVDECIDWIEADPMDPRAYRRMFSGGIRAISRDVNGTPWIVLWEPDGEIAVVRAIMPDAQL